MSAPSRFRLRQGRSFVPLIAILVVIVLPNLLTASLHRSPILSFVFGPQNPLIPPIQLALSLALAGAGVAIWWFGSRPAVRRLIVGYAVLATIVLAAALLSLVTGLAQFGPNQAVELLKDALIVWSMTVLTFSLWYWLIDSGWPESMGGSDTTRPDFLFPQQSNQIPGWDGWTPRYPDYLYLAFNTSTAFSPTEVSPLSQRAKMLMLVQSSLSLIVVATVLARAVNILASS